LAVLEHRTRVKPVEVEDGATNRLDDRDLRGMASKNRSKCRRLSSNWPKRLSFLEG
jgi:hypothetical protein